MDKYFECAGNILCQSDLGFGYPIGDWCTDYIEDMSYLFKDKLSFNEPLANWNTGEMISFRLNR